MVSGYNTAPS